MPTFDGTTKNASNYHWGHLAQSNIVKASAFASTSVQVFIRIPKRQVAHKWNVDKTYVKVKTQWMHLYRAIDSDGNTVEFWFSKDRDLNAAKCFLRTALTRHGRPERITIDGSQTNRSAIIQCDAHERLRNDVEALLLRSSKYLNNMIEQDHRRIKRRIGAMFGFKSMTSAKIILAGIELIHMMRKQQGDFATSMPLSIKQQFAALTA
jgi:putative transposase